MRIHTVKCGEKISDIARSYGVDEEILRMNNDLSDGECTEGEELLVLTPTRTYKVRRGDSVERLALRFGVRRRELAAMNPWIECDGLTPGRLLAIKYDERKYGMAASNGYLFGAGVMRDIQKKLPYLTYLTAAAAVIEDGKIKKQFDFRDPVGLVRSMDKIPLLGVYLRDNSLDYKPELFSEMIAFASRGGFKGVTLGGIAPTEEQIVEIKKQMIGSDLILITELDGNSPSYLSDYSDGSIFSMCCAPGCSAEGDYRGFAEEKDGSRCMLELCSFAQSEQGYLPLADAIVAARRGGCKITRRGGDCHFSHRRLGEVSFSSLEKIKTTLEDMHEYGFMGVSIDIMRTPLNYLMMYNAYFGASPYYCSAIN